MTTRTESELIKITVFRPLDGIRTPYILSLDRQRNLVGDVVDQEALERIKANPHVLARHKIDPTAEDKANAPGHKQLIAQSGVVKHITEKGIVISREPLDEWSIKFEDWLDTSKPNPFPDAADLRLEYFNEEADVARRISEGTCPGCESNRLKVEYRNKLRKHLGL